MKRLGVLVPVFGVIITYAATTAADDPPCNTWEVEYSLAAVVQLSDTAMGAGDGTHAIGPGKVVLHFSNDSGKLGPDVKLMTYEMTDQFTVNAHVFGVGTTVTNDTKTHTTPNICGVSSQGTFTEREHIVRWNMLWNGMHTDGKVRCNGSMCGRMGAPPSGESDVHTPAHPVAFKAFEYGPDMKAFHMDYSVTAKSTTPSQTSRITFTGRETKRSCIYVRPCP